MATFVVSLGVSTMHEYQIDARTSEEAITVAEQMLEEGDRGVVSSSEIEVWDAYPLEDTNAVGSTV